MPIFHVSKYKNGFSSHFTIQNKGFWQFIVTLSIVYCHAFQAA